MKNDTEEDAEDINPFKPASFSSSSVYSDSYDDTSRVSRQSLFLDSPNSAGFTSGDYVDPSRRRLSNRLSLISLILKYGVGGILFTFFAIINGASMTSITAENMGDFLASMFCLGIVGAASTVGIILMIVARVKDKTAKFAKVLMIIYIAEVIVSVLVSVLFAFIIVVGSATYISRMS